MFYSLPTNAYYDKVTNDAVRVLIQQQTNAHNKRLNQNVDAEVKGSKECPRIRKVTEKKKSK
jgi:uncharacterized protein (UPF0212 family)